jgi:hypothetical protein
MVVNFRARAISRGTRKLAWILILIIIIIIIIKKNILSLKKFKGLYDLCYSLQSRSLFGLLEINCSCFGYNTIFFLILTSLCVWIKTFFFFWVSLSWLWFINLVDGLIQWSKIKWYRPPISWYSPESYTLKWNVDDSSSNKPGDVGTCGVFRAHNGFVMGYFSTFMGVKYSIEA